MALPTEGFRYDQARGNNVHVFASYDRIRMDALREISRYDGVPMIHRTNLLIHSMRVEHLAVLIASQLVQDGIEIDIRRAAHLAQRHDDPEIITGDIPSPKKHAMTPEERKALADAEYQATLLLAQALMPETFSDLYIEFQREVKEKRTGEAQVVDIADKWDAYGEIVHEIRCGNADFSDVLNNHRRSWVTLGKEHPIWQLVSAHPDFGLNYFPTVEEAFALPPIRLGDLERGEEYFWQQVMHPDVPVPYQRWLNVSLTMPLHVLGTALFPGWKQEVGNSGMVEAY